MKKIKAVEISKQILTDEGILRKHHKFLRESDEESEDEGNSPRERSR